MFITLKNIALAGIIEPVTMIYGIASLKATLNFVPGLNQNENQMICVKEGDENICRMSKTLRQ